jgi:hypothetical protein
MATAFDNRRENLRRLIEQWNGPAALAAKLGYKTASFMVQMAGPNPTREVTEKTARKIEDDLGLPAGWLDGKPDTRPSPGVDTNQVAEIIRLVGHTAEEMGVKLPNTKLADVVALVYSDAQTNKTLRVEYLQQLLRLLK